MNNKFIVICGGEGSGKSTMLEYIRGIYGDRIVTSREPGGTPFAEAIRNLMFSDGGRESTPQTQFGLVWAARHEHLVNKIIPSLDERPVIVDRFDCCTYAYQIHGGEAGDLENLFWVMRDTFVVRQPDLYVFFDVDPATGLARAASRKGGGNFFDEKKLPFHTRIREGYIKFLEGIPHVVVDANKPLEQVKEEFARIIEECLNS